VTWRRQLLAETTLSSWMYANKQVLDEEELIALDEFAKLEARLEKKKTAKDDKE